MDQFTHKPITLLRGRGEENLKKYLEENPQIQYITCDRAQCFIKVINQALPSAVRISDRFHLVKDIVEGMTGEIASRSRMGVQKQSFDFPSQETVRTRIMESLYNMSSQQKSILKHVDELAFEISHGCADIKILKKKMKGIMDGHDVERASLVDSLKELMNDPTVRTAIDLCVKFRGMINGKLSYGLDKWIDKAMKSDLKALRKFAAGIKCDKEAVQNAMDIYLNNGVLEGTVNKIKAIKRQMFNRASITLLSNKLTSFNT